ncbi:hypothetical protein [Xanthomonas cassavae]|uniref:PDC sensor domain-containing protein n=1 Tax=Xanthomonas cassavae TaxID=56450 RepID=UPI000413CDB2
MTYWGRDGQKLVRKSLTDYETPGLGDWNLKPRALLRQTVAEPYDYKIGGKTVLMTTLSTPILQDGKYLGAVTVDVALAALQQRLGALRPMRSGYVELISPASVVLSSRDGARIGKPVTDARHRSMLEAIKAGKDSVDFSPDADGSVSAYVPLQIGKAQERFALGVVVPCAAIMQQAHRQSAGIEQVNLAVTQMDEATQQNAALVDEATAAACTMEDQASQLAQAVARFTLADAPHVIARRSTMNVAPAAGGRALAPTQ